MPRTSDATGRLGVNAVEKIIIGFGWIFREQFVSDFGVDAHAEVVEDGEPTGRLIALQIKSGTSFFRKRGENYVFYGEARHLAYWENHSLPVFLVLHDPDTDLTLYQKIERRLVTEGSDGRWSIEIPPANTLEAARKVLQDGTPPDERAIRRHRLLLDLPLMEEIERHGEAFLEVHEWVNKGLNFRRSIIRFDDPYGDASHDLETWLPVRYLSEFMSYYFPWLDYEEAEEVEDVSGEVDVHRLSVQLNEVGTGFLMLERFYEDGPVEQDDDALPDEDETELASDEDHWTLEIHNEALEKLADDLED